MTAGGVAAWDPPVKKDDDWQYVIWSWIKEYHQNRENYPPVFLGYGTEDSVTGQGPLIFAEGLENGHVFTVAGGHGYGVFKKIWKFHLDRLEERFKELSR